MMQINAVKRQLSTFPQIKQVRNVNRLSCFAVCTVILVQTAIVFLVKTKFIIFPHKRRTKFIFYPFKKLIIKLIIHKEC